MYMYIDIYGIHKWNRFYPNIGSITTTTTKKENESKSVDCQKKNTITRWACMLNCRARANAWTYTTFPTSDTRIYPCVDERQHKSRVQRKPNIQRKSVENECTSFRWILWLFARQKDCFFCHFDAKRTFFHFLFFSRMQTPFYPIIHFTFVFVTSTEPIDRRKLDQQKKTDTPESFASP